MLTPEDVSKLYSIRTVLGTNKRKLLCPFPDHKHVNYTPSFSIFRNGVKERWRCHGCDRQGDVIDLIGYLNIPGYTHDNPQHLKTAINILTGGRYSIDIQPRAIPQPARIWQGEWQKYFPPGILANRYIAERGIDSDVGKLHGLGQLDEENATYLTIPTFHDDVLVGIKLRLIAGNGPRYKAIEGSRAGLFNYDGIKPCRGTVFFVKGEIAAMVMESFGYYACAPTNGESGDISEFIPALSLASRVIVIGDNDAHTNRPVMKSTQRRTQLLGAQLIFPPPQYKDVDEWLCSSPVMAQKSLNTYLEVETSALLCNVGLRAIKGLC